MTGLEYGAVLFSIYVLGWSWGFIEMAVQKILGRSI